MENIYQNLDFSSNPFEYTDAYKEKRLSNYFVKPQYFELVRGDYNNPNSCIVFAPRGGGKTALLKMIEEWSEDKPILTIIYDNFEIKNEKDFEEIDQSFHLENIIKKTLYALISKHFNDTDKLENLPSDIKRLLSVLWRHYFGKVPNNQINKAINLIKPRSHKVRDFFTQNMWFLSPILKWLVKEKTETEIDFPNEIKLEGLKVVSSLKDQLSFVYNIAEHFGYNAIYVLIDRVDENNFTSRDYEKAFQLIKPLITDLSVLDVKGYSFKFFLWDRIKKSYVEYARPDKIKQYNIVWKKDNLKKILEKRLVFFSNSKWNSFSEFSDEEISPIIDDIILAIAYKSPRNLIRFCSKILDEHIYSNKESKKVGIESLEKASQFFSNQIFQETYHDDDFRSNILKLEDEIISIKKLGEKFNTIKEAEDCLKNWERIGLIKKIGRVKLQDEEDSDIYYMLDTRINRILNSSLTIDYFYVTKSIICENCEEASFIDIRFYNEFKGGVFCWECEHPLVRKKENQDKRQDLKTYKKILLEKIANGEVKSVFKPLITNLEDDLVKKVEILELYLKYNTLLEDYSTQRTAISDDDYNAQHEDLLRELIRFINALESY